MLLPPPCLKGKQDLSSDIALEQADYRSLVISLNACFVLDLAVLPPEELKKVFSAPFENTQRSVFNFPFYIFTFSKDVFCQGRYFSLRMEVCFCDSHQGEVCS